MNGVINIEREIFIAASPEKVFQVLRRACLHGALVR